VYIYKRILIVSLYETSHQTIILQRFVTDSTGMLHFAKMSLIVYILFETY